MGVGDEGGGGCRGRSGAYVVGGDEVGGDCGAGGSHPRRGNESETETSVECHWR